MTQQTHTVFVYGTLKTGHWNNHVLHTGKATLVGTGQTVPKYLLFDGGFPKMATMPIHASVDIVAKLTPLLGHVRGEVWRIDDEGLMNCDRLEGHPKFYCRERIGIRLDGGKAVTTAWAYIIATFPYYERNALLVPKDGVLEWDTERKPATVVPSLAQDADDIRLRQERFRNDSAIRAARLGRRPK